MIKILHLNPHINLTCGISKTIYLIATNIGENYQTHIFCLGGDGIEKFRKAKIDIMVFAVQNRGVIQTLRVFIRLLSIVKKHKIDIIHSHHRYFDLLANVISKFFSIKTISSVHNKVYGNRLLSYKADILIVCSNSIKEHLNNYFKIMLEQIRVIYNFVDSKEAIINFERLDLRKELGIDDQSIAIGFIGRFNIREKGIDILLKAFRGISNEFSNLKLVMIGKGEDQNYITDFITTNNLNAMNLLPKENIFDYYNIIDIVVLPSRVEPFGIVAIEAGLMKKPLIASNADGLKEIIDDGINGLLFPVDNEELLTEKLRMLVNDSKLRLNLGEELNLKVMNNFTVSQIIPKYQLIYQSLINQN